MIVQKKELELGFDRYFNSCRIKNTKTGPVTVNMDRSKGVNVVWILSTAFSVSSAVTGRVKFRETEDSFVNFHLILHQLHWTGTTYSGFSPWKTFWGVRSLRPRKTFPTAIIGDVQRRFFFIHKERMMFLSEQRTDCSNCFDLRRTYWSLLVSTNFLLAGFKSYFR